MQEKKQIKLRVKDEELKGNYSNLMQIFHTKEEFVLDFFLISPQGGILNSRVIMSPGHSKRMVKALQVNIKKYEDQFGKIEEAKTSNERIGFSVEEARNK